MNGTKGLVVSETSQDHLCVRMKHYVGLNGPSSAQDRAFARPADTFHYDWPSLECRAKSMHDQPESDYSSYRFSGGNGCTNPPPPVLNETCYPGVFGLKQASIKDPVGNFRSTLSSVAGPTR